MQVKLVTLLSFLKSRHLEGLELVDRGNHAFGEFVCAEEGSVSKVQEIPLVTPRLPEQLFGLSR